jgi:DNA-binding beta-propeller fold protein YncE
VDGDGHILVVDGRNHRVQKLTGEGKYLAQWGGFGSGQDQLDTPWGITVDGGGHVYVADHKNHRVQKYTPDGRYVATIGSQGTGRGELTRPTDVAVDPERDVYVCDWANNRVQAFGADGRFITTFIGDAQQLAKWAQMTVDANVDVMKARRRVHTSEPEWRFAMPTGVVFDAQKARLIVVDTQRSRLQVYNKLKDYLEPQFNL